MVSRRGNAGGDRSLGRGERGERICPRGDPGARFHARAKAFYGKIFGWTFQDFGKDYVLFNVPGGMGGGFNRVKKVPPKPVVQAYIQVADIEATLKAVRQARGKVVKPKTEIPGYGWWASFADNQGAVLFLFQHRPEA